MHSTSEATKTRNWPAGGGKAGAVIIGGDFQGLGVLRSLARHGIPVFLLDRALCMARFSRHARRFARCPEVRQPEALLDFLTDLAEREGLGGWVLYPNDDETVRFLAEHRRRLEAYYRVWTPPWEVTRFACEKKLTYELAETCGIAVPRTFYPRTTDDLAQLDVALPAILKPSVKEPFYSRTGKKALRVDSKEALLEEFTCAVSLAGGSEMMVQELIPGGAEVLYSVGSLCKNGELLAKVVARRPRQHPMDFGHATTFAETIDIPELEESARKILAAMGYYGLSEVEFMLDRRDGRYKLIEINARPWGWHTLAMGAGVDLPYLLYRDMLGEEVRQNGFAKGARWIRLVTDTPTVAREILAGRMNVREYVSSLKGLKQFAVLSLCDPLPFLVELLMLPYLWKKRGF